MSATVLILGGLPAGAAPPAPRPAHAGDRAATAHRTGAGTVHSLAAPGEDDEEGSSDIMEQADQWNEARSAPGIVAPGAYSAAWAQLQGLPHTGGRWVDETGLPYNSDDPRYRDVNSNSSGGAGNVTGRVVGMAADDHGYVYAGSANGGVWRSATGGGHWQPISDKLPAPATGDLRLDDRGRLWFATGEANTSATSFVGTGVYVLADPRHGEFRTSDRVGGTELENTTIRALRFGGDKVWAATSRGVWSHSTRNLSGKWTLEFAPNPTFLPGGADADDADAAYKNIANDIAIDPRDPSKVILAIGWRSGDDYNGFYTKVGGAWQKITLTGDIASDPDNVGAVTFARSADGSKYYAIEQSPEMLATNGDSNLYGVFVSDSGSPFGPWRLAADYHKLAASGSANTSPGYMPGIQAWYNQFLQVDPKDPRHLYIGLEEVFETKDAGATWTTPAPTGTSTSPAGASTRPSRPATATRPHTPTSTRPRSAATAASRTWSSATTAACTAGRSTARPTRPATPPTGCRSTTAAWTCCSTTRSASAPTSRAATRASPSAAACRTTASRSCAPATA
ncbi:hypothetical protein [Dactylosporangium darangshiense]|uniref:hypothetical protein n=1 Tax=Dactylosporangium darangshiense TaxID=579108 RepID=UPI00363C8179